MKRFARLRAVGAAVGIAVVVTAASAGSAQSSARKTPLDKVDHILVIYEESAAQRRCGGDTSLTG